MNQKGTADHWKLRLKRDRPDLYERVINGDMTGKPRPENAIGSNFRLAKCREWHDPYPQALPGPVDRPAHQAHPLAVP